MRYFKASRKLYVQTYQLHPGNEEADITRYDWGC
jgi:hypothetical protein